MSKRKYKKLVRTLFFITIIAIGILFNFNEDNRNENIVDSEVFSQISDVPEYAGKIYVEINNNVPNFSNDDINMEEDYYSNLDNGRVRNGYDKN